MKKRILTLGIVVALVAALAIPMATLADNTAGQGAGTTYATTIQIKNTADDGDVSSIAFPGSAAGSEVTNPTSTADVSGGDTQVLTTEAGDASPVALLKSAAAYTIWYQVNDTDNWDETVSGENLWTITIDDPLDKATFDSSCATITTWDTPQSTTQTLAAGVAKELYLTVDLENVAGSQGQSVLIILGES